MTLVYHGTSTRNLHKLVSADGAFRWLYVTDTPERAIRYANAQATGVVSKEYGTMAEHTALVAIEVEDAIQWKQRSEDHGTLDTCEAGINGGHIVSVRVQECDYVHCTCHETAAQFGR